MPRDYRFRTIDLRPADGWRATYLYATGLHIEHMAGWLIQEEVEYDTDTSEDTGPTGFRRIVAAVYDEEDRELKPTADDGCFWTVLAPGQPEPDQTQVDAELALRLLDHENQRKLLAKVIA